MMRGPLMQRLLEDRFRLKVHRETREVPVYFLTVAKEGHKLKASQEGSCGHFDPTDLTVPFQRPVGASPWCVIVPPSKKDGKWVWDVRGMSMEVLAKLMNPGRPVIDRTGLSGTYDIQLEWWDVPPPAAEEATTADNTGASLMNAVTKQLGLRFEAGKGPREFVVIDHIEKPSEN
jgi:uncharacterized protein (TIGR03435 family)